MAKKEAKKEVNVCKKCGSEPCACAKLEPKPVVKEGEFSTKIMNDGTKFKVFADGTEELIK